MPTLRGYDCNGIAGSDIPGDSIYYLTSFGGGSDTQGVSCGGPIADGSWWYAADRSRYRCGTLLLVTNPANNRSCIVKVADYGPDVCVEQAAGGPVLDASPLVSQYLFGTPSSGWEDHARVVVAVAPDQSAALGPTDLIARATYDFRRYAIWGALLLAGYAGFKAWQEGSLKIPGLPQPKKPRSR